jgi:hypothetical protein
MRKFILAVVLSCASSVWAQSVSIGEAIEPLIPGLTVRVVREIPRDAGGGDRCAGTSPTIWECVGSPAFPPAWTTYGAFTIGFDAAGNAYHVSGVSTDFGADKHGIILRRVSPAGVMEDVAGLVKQVCLSANCFTQNRFDPTGAIIDVTGGRVWITVSASYCDYGLSPPCAGTTVGTVEISGLPTLFDTLLTFAPGGQLAALVPAHPDGFRNADSMQVWTGDVRTMPDWSQAEPLTCYAAMSPAPGQVVTIADTLPDPPAGHGRYYLTASVNGADRRLGRQYVAGAFSARDPARLPVCQ